MVAARRASWNPALERALEYALEFRKALVVLEPLRVDYPWASERLHAFVLDGMRENRRAFDRRGIAYYPYVETEVGAGKGLLQSLAARACAIVTDDFPCFFLPGMIAAAAARVPVLLEAVDGNGLLPMTAAGKAYPSAAHFRRFVQRRLAEALVEAPRSNPLDGVRLPGAPSLAAEFRRWPPADEPTLRGRTLRGLPIDHEVAPVAIEGGARAARAALRTFVDEWLPHYHERQRHPDANATSHLSPYLHFGHISAHEVFDAVARHEKWTIGSLPGRASGAREGWWQVGAGAEAFLDQLVVWRELAINTCVFRPGDYGHYESLPAWARQTLAEHERDQRPHRYDVRALEAAGTHDAVWNAAQRQLRREGWCHNYMRMLWGKKILEWSASGREALDSMTAIMNRWSLDGRDPNSYAGYAWTLGRYDRPWPERPVFGTVRAMSSASAARKVHMRKYLEQYGEHS
jgi:deoxyribodipyrimidine photo-lyase